MGILCTFWHYVYSKTFSILWISENPWTIFLVNPLFSNTIFKSWIQLFTVSIFELPNKSPPFRLSHFASEKLSRLNVYVLHSLDKQWLPEFVLLITVLNDRKKWCVSRSIFICKQKTKSIHNFFGDNTHFTPGIEAWSRTTTKMDFRMNTTETLIPKGNGYDPILTHGPNISWYTSTKKISLG